MSLLDAWAAREAPQQVQEGARVFHGGRAVLHEGDALEALRGMADCSFESVVTDPPYALTSIVRRFGPENAAPARSNGATGVYARASAGFMGKRWDVGDVAHSVEFWREVWRVLKPGGHVAAFGGTRTHHRLAVAIEDAGFEIRDSLMWVYGSGFPKSLDVSKAIDKAAGVARDVVGEEKVRDIRNGNGRGLGDGINAASRGGPVYMQRQLTRATSDDAKQWDGWGTALKPAWEPIVLARKPLIGTVAENVLAWGCGGLNVDGCRIATEDSTARIRPSTDGALQAEGWGTKNRNTEGSLLGRFPANLCHDGSPEVLAGFPTLGKSQGGSRGAGGQHGAYSPIGAQRDVKPGFGDFGSAARFFYCAKASKRDRAGSKHPTVKPVSLMKWLVKLVTPPGGKVLEPFAGSGTTGQAALEEGFSVVMCEKEPEYQLDVAERMRRTVPK